MNINTISQFTQTVKPAGTAQGRRSAMSEAIDVITEETEVSTTELATVLDVSVWQTIGDMII